MVPVGLDCNTGPVHACGEVIGGNSSFFSFSFITGLTLVSWLEGPVGTLSDYAEVTSKVHDRPMGGDSDGEGRGLGVIAPGA